MVVDENNKDALGESDVEEENLQLQMEADVRNMNEDHKFIETLRELSFLTMLSIVDFVLSIVTVFSPSFVKHSYLFDKDYEDNPRSYDGWGMIRDSEVFTIYAREKNAQNAAKVYAIASIVTTGIGLSIIIFVMFSLCRHGKRFFNAGIRVAAIIFLTTAMMQAHSLHYAYNHPKCEAKMVLHGWNQWRVCDFGSGAINAMVASVFSTFLGAWLMSLVAIQR